VITPAERFGLLLARRRMLADLDQGELARLLGVRRAAIALIERGGRRPRLDTLLQLAAAVEAEPAELLAGRRWVPGVVEVGGRYELRSGTEEDPRA
jgi:transcriptional regulator with XRE-family HTH domain